MVTTWKQTFFKGGGNGEEEKEKGVQEEEKSREEEKESRKEEEKDVPQEEEVTLDWRASGGGPKGLPFFMVQELAKWYYSSLRSLLKSYKHLFHTE